MFETGFILQNVSFALSSTSINFQDLNITLPRQRIGLIGDNGIGKTTFLKLLAGELIPSSGSIFSPKRLLYIPQLVYQSSNSVASILGVEDLLAALERVEQGVYSSLDLQLLEGQWDIQSRIDKAMQAFELDSDVCWHSFDELSGGQQTKILLSKVFIHQTDYILLDEPTNNLDKSGREILYQFIECYQGGSMIVSHDRSLLDKLDAMVVLDSKGFHWYGGNYGFYRHQIELERKSAEQLLHHQQKQLRITKKRIQSRLEKHQRNEAKGRRGKFAQIKAKGSYDKMGFKSQQGRSEKTNKKIRTQSSRMLGTVNEKLKLAQTSVDYTEKWHAIFNSQPLPNKKRIVSIEQLSFGYFDESLVFENFSLDILANEKISLVGRNGCGKSTLIQLISGRLQPLQGKVQLGVQDIAVLDQKIDTLSDSMSLIDNYLMHHPNATVHDAHQALASMNFKGETASQPFGTLSGGERIRAALAIRLIGKTLPELIILDEPTNHLDLKSTEIIEEALRAYQGTLICVSHDNAFLRNIGIQRAIPITDM